MRASGLEDFLNGGLLNHVELDIRRIASGHNCSVDERLFFFSEDSIVKNYSAAETKARELAKDAILTEGGWGCTYFPGWFNEKMPWIFGYASNTAEEEFPEICVLKGVFYAQKSNGKVAGYVPFVAVYALSPK